MIDLTGYDEVNVDGFSALPPGGYVCKIVNAHIGTSNNGNETLYVDFDIAQGDFAGYFKRSSAETRKRFPDISWDSKARLPLVTKLNGKIFFRLKKMLENLKSSNTNFFFDKNQPLDERKLIGLAVGAIFKGRERVGNNGKAYVNAVICDTKPVQDIIDGNFSVPEIEHAADNPKPPTKSTNIFSGVPIDPNDTPF